MAKAVRKSMRGGCPKVPDKFSFSLLLPINCATLLQPIQNNFNRLSTNQICGSAKRLTAAPSSAKLRHYTPTKPEHIKCKQKRETLGGVAST